MTTYNSLWSETRIPVTAAPKLGGGCVPSFRVQILAVDVPWLGTTREEPDTNASRTDFGSIYAAADFVEVRPK